jgi:mannitol 2-dehydrogenase
VLPVIRDLLAAGRDCRAAVIVVACWARAWEGVDDAGAPIAMVDTRSEDLMARARTSRADPLSLIKGNAMFANLAHLPEFTRAFAEVLSAIHRDGVRQTIEAELEGPGGP